MVNYTQRQLAREWNRRTKAQKLENLKKISIYKLKDGTYTDEAPSEVPDIRWFVLIAILASLLSYVLIG